MKLVWTILSIIALLPLSTFAAEKLGFSFPDTLTVRGKKLVLNGIGVREATVFKVDVYAAGLYLENKSQEAEKILESKQVKRIELRFVRDVAAKKLRKAWQEAFAKNCQSDCEAYQEGLTQLNSHMSDTKEKDTMAFNFGVADVGVWVGGKRKGTIKGKTFTHLLLKAWLGKPPNRGLKEGMLGNKG